MRRGLAFALLVLAGGAGAVDFQLREAQIRLEDRSSDVSIRYRSLRLNRALDVWNAEVIVQNNGATTLAGPFVLLVDRVENATGPFLTDGALPGMQAFYDLSGRVADGELSPGESTQPYTITLGRAEGVPRVEARFFTRPDPSTAALAVVRTLDALGQPLPEVEVMEFTPSGVRTNQTDAVFGMATLGSEEGIHVWTFQRENWMPVWRWQVLQAEQVATVPSPRLTRRGTNTTAVSPLGGAFLAGSGVRVDFPAGAVLANGEATLTPLTSQTLPAYLPLGWSPMRSFWIEIDQPLAAEPVLTLSPPMSVGPNDVLALARWNEAILQWQVTQLLEGNGTNAVVASFAEPGAFAWVRADTGDSAPPAPRQGRVLAGSSLLPPDLSTVETVGRVNPPSSVASRQADKVTAQATVTFSSNSGPLPSGLVFRCEVTDDYKMRDGTVRVPPPYEQFISAYQWPGTDGAGMVQARFPLRPTLLFGLDEMEEGLVRAEVLVPTAFAGKVIEVGGGLLAQGRLRILAGEGDLESTQAGQLRRLLPHRFFNFNTNGIEVVEAFELVLGGVRPGRHLVLQVDGLATNAHYVLARVRYEQDQYGLEPLERLATDPRGRLASTEPVVATRLPGLPGSGQYLLLRVPGPQALVRGTARDASGQPAAGAPVRVVGAPWLTFADDGGNYRLVAPVGPSQLLLTDLATGNQDLESISVGDPSLSLGVDLDAVPTGPRVLLVSPGPGSSGVSRVTPVTVAFSEPVNAASLLGGGMQLLDTNNQPVPASLTLNLQGNVATLLPTEQLRPVTQYVIQLSSNIVDLTGLPLDGVNLFSFTTESDRLDRLAAKVTSHEPTNGLARMVGSAGVAEPDAPVILVNETTGQTATVLSKPDGSFDNFIEADVDDFLSAVIVNANGTRNRIPVSRQIFPDGRVGLFQGGGILEAQSDGGPVRVIIEPGSIKTKNIFKLESLGLAELFAVLNNQLPADATLLGGARLSISGEPADGEANMSFPFDPVTAGIEDPEDGAYVMTLARMNGDGEMVYQVVDKMRYEDGELTSNTLPFLGFLAALAIEEVITFAAGETAEYIVTSLYTGKDGVPVTGVVEGARTDASGNSVFEPLTGALVTLHTLDFGFRFPGRVPAGLTYATTGPDGTYAFLVPKSKGSGYALSATHPRYTDFATKPVTSFSLFGDLGAKEIDFRLKKPARVGSGIKVSMAHAPLIPAIGGTARFEVAASAASAAPTIMVGLDAVNSLTEGVTVTMGEVTLSNQVNTVEGTRRSFAVDVVGSTNKVEAILKITLSVGGSNPSQPDPYYYPIRFSGDPFVSENPVEPADVEDGTGPMVVASFPAQGGMLQPGRAIRLVFSEPVDAGITNTTGAVVLSGPGAPPLGLKLSLDQQALEVNVGKLVPDSGYTLAINTTVKDLSGNNLDQDLGKPGLQGFNLEFRSPARVVTQLPGLQVGGGAAVKGNFVFALDRAAGTEGFKVYDVSDPNQPMQVAQFNIPEYPRDLVLITNWAYLPAYGEPARTNRDLVVIVGGIVSGSGPGGEQDGISTLGQFLRIFDVTDPVQPERLMGAVLTRRNTVVSKAVWRAPHLAYLENGSDFKQIGIVDLQEMIIGFRTPKAIADVWFLLEAQPGTDADGNGDYAGPNDTPPVPAAVPPEFFGKRFAYVLEATSQHVLDFDYDFDAGYVGVTLSGGSALDPNGVPTGMAFPPRYQTLADSGVELDPADGIYDFGDAARPKRLRTLFGVSLLTTNGAELRNVAFVSLSPDDDGSNTLALIDVTLPASPDLIRTFSFPDTMNLGFLQSVRDRPDGLIELATTTDKILLDPAKLTLPDVAAGSLHPAIVSILPGTGSGNLTLGANAAGVHVVNLGGRTELVQVSPRLRFVLLPGVAPFDPVASPPSDPASLLTNMIETAVIGPARLNDTNAVSTLDPPSPLAHYYVLIDAPGALGSEIELGLESLNRSGYPLQNKGRDHPPVRAASSGTLNQIRQPQRTGCDAPIGELRARQLSGDPLSPFYNLYLSTPFALINEKVSETRLAELKNSLSREILWSAFYVRAFIDPNFSDAITDPWRAEVDTDRLVVVPRAVATAETLMTPYILGPNPSPPGGGMAVPGTFGMVGAHNGAFQNETLDMILPGRRMPIVFERCINGQDLYEGPFGRGWDFYYNQSLVYLRPSAFAPGATMPLIIRQLVEDSTTAESGDVILNNGEGRTILFKNVGPEAPQEILSDPLVTDLGWVDKAREFFLPDPTEPGVFDILVHFRDGQFARLTPEGTQYWHGQSGRLEKIYHRHEKNWHQLVYNERDELVKIIDKAIDNDDRYLEIGYYRFTNDPLFENMLDERTDKPFIAGKIRRLRDYAGRDVDYFYSDDGILEERLGPELAGANGGFSGRPRTVYLWSDACAGDLQGVVAGDSSNGQGTPLFAGMLDNNKATTSGQGAGGTVSYTPPAKNEAASMEDATSDVTGPDGTMTAYKFDKFGFPKEMTFKPAGGQAAQAGDAMHEITYNGLGLVEKLVLPEGNYIVYTYDTNHMSFRSRGNLLTEERFPGPRTGDPAKLTATYMYDARYNLRRGQQQDFNGNNHTYTLTGDSKDVAEIDHDGDDTSEWEFNDYGQLTRMRSPDGTELSVDYDMNSGFKTQETRDSINISFSYDGTIAGQLGAPTTINLPRGAGINVAYDERLMPTSITRGQSLETRAYDENGNLMNLERQLGGGDIYREEREYSQISFLEKITVKNVQTEMGTQDLVTTFTPDSAWRIDQVTLAGGEVREFEYDHLGHVVRVDTGSHFVEYERDLHGNVVTIKPGGTENRVLTYDGYDRLVRDESQVDAGAETREFTYFGNGERRLIKLTGAGGGVVLETEVMSVDAVGRPTQVVRQGDQVSATINYSYPTSGAGGSVVVDGPRETITSMYDRAGRVTSRDSSLADVTLTQDDNRNVTQIDSVEEGTTYSTFFTYDDLDWRLEHRDLVGRLFSFTPRLDGGVTKVTDGRNHEFTQNLSVLGEVLEVNRPNGVGFVHRYDANRQMIFVGDDSGKGHDMAYTDGTLRMVSRSLRKQGSTYQFNDPNLLNLPETVMMPGGSVTLAYDKQGRIIGRDVTYTAGDNYRMNFTLDALGRIVSATYGDSGQYSFTTTYDLLGPMTSVTYNEAGGSYTVGATLYADGTRQTVAYPSGPVVSEQRQVSGRLQALQLAGSDLYRVQQFAGMEIPGTVTRAQGRIREVNDYDLRKRVLSRRYERTGAGGGLLAEVRYRYDDSDNIIARQEVHRHARTDLFEYDAGNRLTRADLGARPRVQGTVRPGLNGLQTGFGLDHGFHARRYTYDAGGLDLLTGHTLFEPDAGLAPAPLPFAGTLGGHDDFLQAQTVEAFHRGASDPLGNTLRTLLWVRPVGASQPVPIGADLTYNGLSHLVRVERDDGVTIRYEYQHQGLLHRRTVSLGGTNVSDRDLVYDQGRLIEEHEQAGANPGLHARYYYVDEDSPIAGDIRDATGTLRRYHYLKDGRGSVMAVADDSANVVERVQYDPWGQPTLQLPDTNGPVVSAVVRTNGNELLVVFSETVLPRPLVSGGGSDLLTSSQLLSPAFQLEDGVQVVPLDPVLYEENLPGGPAFGAVVRLGTQSLPSGNAVLRVLGGSLLDEWGNTNGLEEIVLPLGNASDLLYQDPVGFPTAPIQVARSSVGSPFLFHGQYFDYDAGLVYLRRRFYDPFTGQFLQRDPNDYEDSVNLYAGFRHNPTTLRDPTGANTKKELLEELLEQAAKMVDEAGELAAAGIKEADLIKSARRQREAIEEGIKRKGQRRYGDSAHAQTVSTSASKAAKFKALQAERRKLFEPLAEKLAAKMRTFEQRLAKQASLDDTHVWLKHGTTKQSAGQLRQSGPNLNFKRPGESPPGEFFFAPAFGKVLLQGDPAEYALNKAVAFGENGPAVLYVKVPKALIGKENMEELGKGVFAAGEIKFSKQFGHKQLMDQWDNLEKLILTGE